MVCLRNRGDGNVRPVIYNGPVIDGTGRSVSVVNSNTKRNLVKMTTCFIWGKFTCKVIQNYYLYTYIGDVTVSIFCKKVVGFFRV